MQEENSLVEQSGSTGVDITDAAIACNSLLEVEGGGEAGAKGTRFSAGFAQQIGIAQCFEVQPWQQQLDCLASTFAAALADLRKTL